MSTTAGGLLALAALALSPATATAATAARTGAAQPGIRAGTSMTAMTAAAEARAMFSVHSASAVGRYGLQPGMSTVGLRGWRVQSTAPTTNWTTGTGATQSGDVVSTPGFSTAGWLPVKPDDAGAAGTEAEALLQNGVCPDDPGLQPVNQETDSPSSVFFSDNMQLCFGPPMTNPGPDTDPLFDVPWWFRTDFSASLWRGQDAKLVINGVVGQADVWVNGTEVATEATVLGDYTSYAFDITDLLRHGTNSLALELYPNSPNSMFTLDDVDWNQIPPDNNTGIQFPVQLHVAGPLGISNTYVTQNDAPDMSSAALTVHADVTNNTGTFQTGTVFARISPPGGQDAIDVSQQLSMAPGASRTVTFSPGVYSQLVIHHPQLWWPYQMGGQPMYRLQAGVAADGGPSDTAPPADFGIRSVTTYLTRPTVLAPEGVRVFEVNGVPFDFRAGGWSENLFLHYSASDLANQITLIKSMGLDGIRTEGKQMPQGFYDQMDRAGILVDAGFQCCDKWQPSFSGNGVTSQDYHVMYESSLTIGQQLRDHPSVANFSWSDNNPINEQETASLAGFSQSGFQEPIISSAEYNSSGILGPSGEKEGPYDWVPPAYWYDTTHSSNNANDFDSTLTNVGGAWGFDSEQSAGDTVPTMDSANRFLSAADEATLWQQPDAHQYHTNYESTDGTHSGYDFGTLDNLDTAVAARYGQWNGLSSYVEEAQLQNYEDTRAQFEAYLAHWNNQTPSTGTDYWQLNKGWPTLLWDLYNYDYDQAGSYFGAKKANESLHVLYTYDTGGVTVDNLTGTPQPGLSVQSRVYALDGTVLDQQATTHPITLSPQQVDTGVLTPHVPAATTPPTPAQTYFVELILRQHGTVVDRNVYWLSTQADVLDWGLTEGQPQANGGTPLTQYADMTALQGLPGEPVQVVAATGHQPGPNGDNLVTNVTITNPSSNHAVAFFLRADVRRGDPSGNPQPGDNQVLPITWSDNDITLWPGESQTLTAHYRSSALAGATPVVSLYGSNVPDTTVPAVQTPAAAAAQQAASAAPGVAHFGQANGTAHTPGTARPGIGAHPGTAAAPGTRRTGPPAPAWTVTSVANSPTSTPSTSFTQGDNADTYTLTATNSGNAPTDGTTPVTLTDILDPNLVLVSASGTGWSCDTSNNPTITCTSNGGAGGGPAVLAPGQSYPPVTVTVQVLPGTGFGNQDSTDGIHVTNAAFVAGGDPANPATSLASPTPIVGMPDLTVDDAMNGAIRQGDTGDQYEVTVQNVGAAPTDGSATDPITATITGLPAGETIQALYGSGWTCNLGAITTPQPEPADTCYRSDVLPGENGQEPPVTEIVSVAGNAPSPVPQPQQTIQVSGGGMPAPPTVVGQNSFIQQAADLNAASSHTGDFTQGDQADTYTLAVSNVDGPNAPTAGGPSAGLVTLTDSLPWGLTATAMSGTGWTCAVASVTCYRTDSLAAGSSYPQVALTVSVAANAPASLTNTVTVAGGGMTTGANSSTSAGGQTGTDPTTVNQTGPAGTPPPPNPPTLVVASTHAGSFAQGSESGTYTLTASDRAGAGPVSGMVTLTDTLPPGLTPVRMSGTGWSCSLAPPTLPPVSFSRHNATPNTYEPQPTCFRFGSLAPGTAYPPVTLHVAVADNTQPSVTNSVSVSGGGAASPATASDPTTVGQVPALVVSAYPTQGGTVYAPFIRGRRGNDAYHITVANDGFAPTSGPVLFQVHLPAGLTPLSVSAGPDWSCVLATVTCTTRQGVTLAAGQQDQVTVAVAVAADAPPSAETPMRAWGGGEVPAAGLDLTNDYSTVTNGGEFTEPAYIAPAAGKGHP